MRNEQRKLEIINYIEKASVILLGILFVAFPLIFTNLTTDFFTLPKQTVLIFLSLLLFLLYGAKTILAEKVSIRRTPFDLPVLLFAVALLLSTIFSVAKFESVANFIPALFAVLSFFAITHNTKNERNVMVLVMSLLTGAALLSLISVFAYFKIYVFPFDFTKVQTFTPAGSLMDQLFYLLFVLPIGVYFLSPFIFSKTHRLSLTQKKDSMAKLLGFGLTSTIISIGLFMSIYIVIKQNLFVVLPIDAGFQTAFAAISQDSTRIFQGLLFGTGFGEFFIDFTKFKLASFNTSPYWSVAFFHSSSFVLELLATTGLVGLLSFLFLCFKVIKERPLFIPLIIALALSFVLPLSFYTLTLIFFLLGVYASIRGLHQDNKYFDVELEIVALKKGFISFTPDESTTRKQSTRTLSYIAFVIIILFTAVSSFLTYDYVNANLTFEKSLVAAAANNGQQTYNLQNTAIASFAGKYVDSYYRVFSQTNLALANALAASIPQGQQPSQQTTQTIYTLVQQSINSARQATTLSPENSLNWQNLSSIYRALIGFGQNADSFAVLAQDQARKLDPTTPGEYIALGGIYYQLRVWDKAQDQFQQAINLKPDFPNAYYNLGHVLQEKGDLQGALTQYQSVKQLVGGDPVNLAKINQEIEAVQAQLGQQASQQAPAQQTTQNPLTIPTPSVALPKQNPPIKIPGLSGTVSPTPTGTQTPSPTPTP
jgi:tetratricopeptide (TPR) repeat protein